MMNKIAMLPPLLNLTWGMGCRVWKDNLPRQFPEIHIVVPTPHEHYTPTDWRRGCYSGLSHYGIHTMQWPWPCFGVEEGRERLGTSCHCSQY